MDARSKQVSNWRSSFTKGTGFDSWGQLVEAVDEYQMLSKKLLQQSTFEAQLFTDDQKKTLTKISACLDLRAKALQSPQATDGFSLNELRKVESAFSNLLSTSQAAFPVSMPAGAAIPRLSTQRGNFELDIEGDEIDDEDEDDEHGNLGVPTSAIRPTGRLLQRIPHEKGTTDLTVRIEKIGLKDASIYLDPFITISVKDSAGVDVTKMQDTPVAIKREDPYIVFDVDVEIQRPLEKMPKGTAIFFELKHYKPKKKTISTKCFAFLEMDEIKQGQSVIELYQKPTDYKKKKLSLVTAKPLYLHLHLLLHDD
ncbi:axin interactor, dorsalization-associated protein-like [Amphiura filiformis]|uniref:axin interactor, dorsalization-associated protein-like n=1 Tax=Amphiura filiformis TaxID=82378 RepID=UPI003B224330